MSDRTKPCHWGQGYIPSLDGWRALSIIMVLVSHSSRVPGFPESWKNTSALLFSGDLGVRCFFVISGFLITTLLLREKAKTGSINLKSFYIRRALRIFPVYFAFLACIALIERLGPFDQPSRHWWHLLTFTSNYSPLSNWPTGHTWSLSCEEQFYLLWPSLVVLLGLMSWSAKTRFILAIPFVISPLSRVLTYLQTFPDNPLFSLFSLTNYLDSLAVGCALAFIHPAIPSWLHSNAQRRIAIVAATVAIILPHLLSFWRILGPFAIPFGPTCQALGMAFLISLSIHHPNNGAARFLNLRPIAWLGLLSYSLYIWQQLFCSGADLFGWNASPFMSFPLWLASSLAVACLSYYLFEKPLIQLRHRFHSNSPGS